MQRMLFLSAALALTACSTIAPPSLQRQEPIVWLRADGQSGRNNPALQAEFAAAQATCRVRGGTDRACMAQRGYIPVRPGEADARAAALRQAAAASAAATAPPAAGTAANGDGTSFATED